MLTEVDEGRGLVKSSWVNVRHRVSQVEPEFARIVDEINPDKSFPVFLAYYPYGDIIADTISPFIPKMDFSSYRLTDKDVPKNVIKHLGYGQHSLPMSMIIDKHIEYFVDMPEEKNTIPWAMYDPGKVFPMTMILKKQCERNYAPNGVLVTAAGARSVSCLPNIGCATHHIHIQREFNIHLKAPKSLYEHWYIFKEIINSKIIQSNWRCAILYFSEKWIEKINTDKAWLKLRAYILELAWERYEFDKNRNYYEIIFSLILKRRNLKPNPYLTDTAKHLFTIALGAAPGYSPATDENALPYKVIQSAYLEYYGLKKQPTIMQPKLYNFEKDKYPVYYSLQNPSTHVFSPKSRKISSTLFELRELEHLVSVFVNELAKENAIGSDTILHEVAKSIQFQYFHNEFDSHHIIKPSSEIISFDKNFGALDQMTSLQSFPEDARFVRGCVSIRKK